MRDFIDDLTNKERAFILAFVLAVSALIAEGLGYDLLGAFDKANDTVERSVEIVDGVGE